MTRTHDEIIAQLELELVNVVERERIITSIGFYFGYCTAMLWEPNQSFLNKWKQRIQNMGHNANPTVVNTQVASTFEPLPLP